jgi:HEAT repeat protein
MLAILLLSAAPLLGHVQDTKQASREEQVANACALLEEAFAKDASRDDTVRALRVALELPDERVIAVMDAKGLRHEDREVRGAVAEVLGRMDHPAALTALHELVKRDKKELKDAPPRYAALLRAIARHGKESSIPILVEDPFQSPDRGVIQARILGLGHIRSPKSVDELIRLMRSTPRPRVADHMEMFRLALVQLTGVDKGTDQGLWINWYGDQTKIEIAPEPPELPRELRKRWNMYWGREEGKEEEGTGGDGKRRKDKGQ